MTREMLLDPAVVWERYSAQPHRHPRALFQIAMNEYAAGKGKAMWAEKSPWHLRHVAKVVRWFPAAKVICIVRDGRDAVSSTLTMPGHRHDVEWNALNWRRAGRLCRQWSSKYADQFVTVRFEDLLADPEQELSRLCRFVGVEFEPQQLDHGVKTSVRLQRETWKEKIHEPLDPSRAYAWREKLEPRELWQLNAIMGTYLRHFRYPCPGLEGAPLGTRLRLRLSVPLAQTRKTAAGVGYRASLITRRFKTGWLQKSFPTTDTA